MIRRLLAPAPPVDHWGPLPEPVDPWPDVPLNPPTWRRPQLARHPVNPTSRRTSR